MLNSFFLNQGSVDQVLDRLLAQILDSSLQFLALIDLRGGTLLGAHNLAYLGEGDDLPVNHGGNAVEHLLGGVQGDLSDAQRDDKGG